MLGKRHQYRILMAAFAFALIGMAFFAGGVGLRLQDSLVDHPTKPPAESSASDQHQRESTWERWTDPLAVFTFLLAWGTFLLARGVYKQIGLARQAIALAREEFISTHRPRIAVRDFRVLPDSDGKTTSVTFLYVNRGSSDARIIEIGSNMSLGPSPAGISFAKTGIDDVTLASGDKEIFEAECKGLHFARIAGQIRPVGITRPIYFTGYVRYADALGRERETGFCRNLEVGTNRWVRVKKSEYEYQD